MLYITGANGHSGRWLIKRLQEERYNGRIRCVMRETKEKSPDKYEVFEGCDLDVEYVVGDLTDDSFLEKTLEDIDTIIHTSGIGLSPKIIEVAIAKGVKWAILVHTTGRFSKYKSASAGYIEIEDDILKLRDKINITVLRPTMIYGSSRDRNMYRLVSYLGRFRIFPVFGDGKNLMQPVHAKDLGNAYYDVLVRPDITKNKEYDLSGKEPIEYRKIIETICSYLNRKVLLINIPFKMSVFAAKVYNALFGKHAIITVEQVLRMQEDKNFSHEAATRDFGYHPYTFEEGIKAEVEEYLNGKRVDFSQVKYQ